jgi:ribosomal protein L11 methyltransferase
MAWQQLTFHLPTSVCPQSVEDRLVDSGAQALTLQDAGDCALFELIPHSQPLWPRVKVTALFADTVDRQAVIDQLTDVTQPQQSLNPVWEILPDQDWQAHCQQLFNPICFADRLWIIPSWHTAPDPAALQLSLDPGLAFGTGSHPTTYLCLNWLAQQDLTGKTLIDYGCGSGILALAMVKLGAAKVIAHDIEDQALQATLENAQRNHITPAQLVIVSDPAELTTPADIIIANILANPLITLADRLTDLVKPQGYLGLSGILADQTTAVIQAYQPAFAFDTFDSKDDWMFLLGRGR